MAVVTYPMTAPLSRRYRCRSLRVRTNRLVRQVATWVSAIVWTSRSFQPTGVTYRFRSRLSQKTPSLRVVTSRVADAVLARAVQEGHANVDGEADWRQKAMERLTERSRGRYQVPKVLHCDRTCLVHPMDAEYVDQMQVYLFGEEEVEVPIIRSGMWRVRVGHDRNWAQETKVEWTLVAALGRAVSYEDYYIARRQSDHVRQLMLFNVHGVRQTILHPWEWFPEVPSWVPLRADVRGMSMPSIRALTYFAHVANRYGGRVLSRWNIALNYELFAHSLVAHKLSWIRPLTHSNRVWVASDAYISWISETKRIPGVVVESTGDERIAPVGAEKMVDILTAASKHERAVARRDYATNTVVAYVLCPDGPQRPDNPLPGALPSRERGESRAGAVMTPSAARGSVPVETPPPASSRKRAYDEIQPAAPPVTMTGRGARPDDRRVGLAWLRNRTGMPPDMMGLLRGSGPWSFVEIINTLSLENIRMNTEIRRLQADVDRLQAEARLQRTSNSYADGGYSYSRGYDADYDDPQPRDYRPSNTRQESAPAYRSSSYAAPSDPYAPAPRSPQYRDPYDDPYGTSSRGHRDPYDDPYDPYRSRSRSRYGR